MPVKPNTAIWNLGDLYLQGMRLTYATTTTFTVAQGQARDSTNLNDIVLSLPPQNDGTPILTPFTLNGAANGAGGLDQGALAASTLYYVFAIASSMNSTINLPPSPVQSLDVPPFTTPDPTSPVTQDGYYVQANVLISTSRDNPLLPFGYDMFRRIGAVSTDAGSVFRPFFQTGFGKERPMHYQTAVAPGSAATAGTTTYATIGVLTTLVPQIACEVLVDVSVTPNAANNGVFLAPFGNTAGGDVTRMSGAATGSAALAQLKCPAAFNAAGTPIVEVDYKTSSASDVVAFLIAGYVDQL